MKKEMYNINTSDILMCLPGCIYWKDKNGVYLGCNQMEAELAGLNSPKDLIGKTDYDVFGKNIAEVVREVDQRVMETKVPEETIETASFPDGRSLITLTRKSPLYDENKNVIGIMGVSIDITNRKKEEDLQKELIKQQYANSILQNIPVCVYWKDKEGVYLGCNQAEAKLVGLEFPEDVIGKTDYDLSWKYEADVLRETDRRIMKSGLFEEVIEKVTANNGKKVVLTRKSPLYDENKKVIGILGVSLDITDRQRAAELEVENKLQREVTKITEQVVHDIRSPITSLSMLVQYCKGLSERERGLLKKTISTVESIANTLLNKYDEKKNIKFFVNRNVNVGKYILVYFGLKDVVDSIKNINDKETKITFNYFPNPKDKFVFIKGDYSDFYRMMLNLLKNAEEAILPQADLSDQEENEKKKGVIDINFVVKEGKVEIRVKDNGKGMPKEMVDDILNDIEVGSTKKEGHGIGMQQIKSTLKAMNAQMGIKSIEEKGTEFTLIFSQTERPKWFADKIVLHRNDIVIVLGDDLLIHDVKNAHFHECLSEVTIKYFNQGSEAINFIESIKEKNKIFLLVDYELRRQNINGIDVIEKYNLQKQAIVITNIYTPKIKDFNEKSKTLKFFHKEYINDIPLFMEGKGM